MSARRLPLGLWVGLSLALHLAVASWLSSRAIATHAPTASPSPLRVVARLVAPTPVSPPPSELPPAPEPTPEPVVERPPPPPPAPEPMQADALAPPPPAEPLPPVAAPPPLPVQELAAVAPAAPAEAGAPGDPDELERYFADLHQRISSQRSYPRQARRRGIEGVVTLRLRIDERGALVGLQTVGRAPSVLARQARSAVEKAAPFPAPPDRAALSIDFELEYDLDD